VNFDELQKQIVALLVTAAKDAVGELESDFKKYARKLAEWTSEAIQTGNTKLLRSIEGQVKLLAAQTSIKNQRRLLATLTNILEIVATAGFALIKGIV
jgi:hypothetical protein